MASTEETAKRSATPDPSTATMEPTSTTRSTATGASAIDDGHKKPKALHDDGEASSPKTNTTEAVVTVIPTTTKATTQTTTMTAAPASSSYRTVNRTRSIDEETSDNLLATSSSAPTPTSTVERSNMAAETNNNDGNNSKKRKAILDDQESSSSLMTITEAAAVTRPTTTTTEATDNIQHTREKYNNGDGAEGPPTKKRGRGRPRKSERGPGRPRKRRDDKKIVFYAIRPGGPVIERPIIFFGFKEFDFFHKCVNQKLESTSCFSYRVCDSLVDALSYVGAADDPDSLKSRRVGENSGESTDTSHSNKQRKLNPPALPEVTQEQQLQQQQIVLKHQQQLVAAQAAATAQHQQMLMRQQQMVATQATQQTLAFRQQQQRMVAAQVAAATAAVQQQQQLVMQQQQKIMAAQAAAAAAASAAQTKKLPPKETDQQEEAVKATAATTTTTQGPNSPGTDQPVNNDSQKKVPALAVTQQQTAVQQQTTAKAQAAITTAASQQQQQQQILPAQAATAAAASTTTQQQQQHKLPYWICQQQQMMVPRASLYNQLTPIFPKTRTATEAAAATRAPVTPNVTLAASPPAAPTAGNVTNSNPRTPICPNTAAHTTLTPPPTATTTTTTTTVWNPNAPTPAAAARAAASKAAADERKRRWDEKFEMLRLYKEEHGHCDVRLFMSNAPPEYKEKYKNLLPWVTTQRERWKLDPTSTKAKLTEDQRERLTDLGFVVDVEEFRWDQKFDLLREYKLEYGDCNIFKTKEQQPLTEKYKPLIHWGKKQQQAILEFDENENSTSSQPTKTKITAEHRELLLDLGLPTLKTKQEKLEAKRAFYDQSLKKKIEELKAYKKEHGHLNFKPHTKERQWICARRREYAALQDGKPSFLKLEHIVALTGLGLSMTPDHPPVKRVHERVMEYVEFVKRHGRFPDRRSKDPEEAVLGSNAQRWRFRRRVHSQGITKIPRRGKTEIPQELIDALDSVNFRWEVKNLNQANKKSRVIPWEERFELLKKYKEKHGHCEPPKRHPKVGLFAYRIRQQYKFMIQNKKSSLTVERFRKLSEIGFRFKTASVAGVENKRQRFVDNDSSGYDTSSDEDNNNNDNADDNNTDDDNDDNGNRNYNLRRIGKGYRRNRDDEDHERVGTDDGGNNGRSGNADNGKRNRDDNDQPPTGAASILNHRNGQWAPNDCMWN